MYTTWSRLIVGKEGRYQVILKKVELPVVPHDSCQNVLRQSRLGKYFLLDRSFICAGGEAGRDTCKVKLEIIPEYIILYSKILLQRNLSLSALHFILSIHTNNNL